MSSTVVNNSGMYCSEKGINCSCANLDGYCTITGCIHHDNMSVEYKVIDNGNNHDMCTNCRHDWKGRCDKGLNPLVCDSWEPDSHG